MQINVNFKIEGIFDPIDAGVGFIDDLVEPIDEGALPFPARLCPLSIAF